MSSLSDLLPAGGGGKNVNFVASGVLPNGKPVVLKANGQVEAVAQTGDAQSIPAGSAATYNSSGTDPLVSSRGCCFIPQVANKFVIIYKDATAGHGTAVVGTVSGISISFGTPVVFNAGLTNFMSIDFTASVSGRCVIAYSNNANSAKGTVVIGTVSGTGISFSSPIIFNDAVTRVFGVAFGSGSIDDRLVISYMDQGNSNYGTAICGDVNAGGTAIAFGSEVVFNSGTSNFADVAFDPSNTKFVICYKNQSNSHYATAIVGSASSTSLSFGSNVVFLSSYTTDVSVRYNPNVGNQFVVLCSDQYASPTKGVAYVGTVSNTTPSFGPQVVFNPLATTLQSIAFDPNTAGRLLVSYSDDGNSSKSTVNIGTISGSTLSFGNKIIAINLTSSPQTVAFDSNTSGKFVFPFIDYTNSSYGKSLVCQLDTSVTNLTATNFLGITDAAVASGASGSVTIKGGLKTGLAGGTFAVTVANPGAGNRYYINGVLQQTLNLREGFTYKFDQSASSNSGHPFRFSTTANGTHAGGSEYTTGVTTAGTPGNAGAYTQIVVAASAPTLYYYCTNHSLMGGQANTIAAIVANSIYYVQADGSISTVSTSPAVRIGRAFSPTSINLEFS